MTNEHCSTCSANMPTLTEEQINAELNDLNEWTFSKDNNCISRDVKFKGFASTMGFINAVAWISQQEKHHPDISFGYNYATITYQTHEAGGITSNDIICAKKVDALLS